MEKVFYHERSSEEACVCVCCAASPGHSRGKCELPPVHSHKLALSTESGVKRMRVCVKQKDERKIYTKNRGKYTKEHVTFPIVH